MKTCDPYQDRMLEHLYGLLEADESQHLLAHVEQCGGCQAALKRAQGHKLLLAAAAKGEFPGVHFQAPTAEPVILKAVPPPQKQAGGRTWRRWALAAALILVIGGLSVPSGIYIDQQARVNRLEAAANRAQFEESEYNKAQFARVDEAQRELANLQGALASLTIEKQRSEHEAVAALQQKPLRLHVTGPKTIQPGAANQFQIQVTNQAHMPVAAVPVSAKVVDRDQQLVCPGNLVVQGPGNYRLDLPRDLPVTPNSDLTLVVSAGAGDQDKNELAEKLELTSPLYLTHLTTDKPMYQPGDMVHFRSLTLERFSLKPVEEELHLIYTIQSPLGEELLRRAGTPRVTDAAKGLLMGPNGKPVTGVGAGEYQLTTDAKGGEYTLTVSEGRNRFQPQKRKFIVNQYEKPRLRKELEYAQKSYGPGDQAEARCNAKTADGKVVATRPVSATVLIDGRTYNADGKPAGQGAISARTDADGKVTVKFKLPAQMDRGQGTLSVVFDDGTGPETIAKPIPIVLKKLLIDFYPEGGDLVDGLPNRVYFQARTTLDKPAEVKGRIVDQAGDKVADVATFNDPENPGANQGLGAFTFTPKAGRSYELKIDQPVGIEGQYKLPDSKPDGVVLNVAKGVTGDKDSINVLVHNGPTDRTLLVGAYCRGRLMVHQRISVNAGKTEEVSLKPDSGIGGVYRITVFEERPGAGKKPQLIPVAERLMYRTPLNRLNLTLQPDKKQYVPADKATVSIQAKDEKGQPAAAILMVAAVDKNVLTLADEKSWRSMPTHFLLTNEVRKPEDLEHTDFLLTSHANGATALDLLLGTQGWRRFAEQNPQKFRNEQKEEADRLLVMEGILTPELAPQVVDLGVRNLAKVRHDFDARIHEKQAALPGAEARLQAVQNDETFRARSSELKQAALAAQGRLESQRQTLDTYKEWARTYVPPVLQGFAVVLFLLCVVSLVKAWRRGASARAVPYFVMAACSILLFGFVFAWPYLSTEKQGLATMAKNESERALPMSATKPARDADWAAPVKAMDAEAKPADRPVPAAAAVPGMPGGPGGPFGGAGGGPGMPGGIAGGKGLGGGQGGIRRDGPLPPPRAPQAKEDRFEGIKEGKEQAKVEKEAADKKPRFRLAAPAVAEKLEKKQPARLEERKKAKDADKAGAVRQRLAGGDLAEQAREQNNRGEVRLMRPDAQKRENVNGVAGEVKGMPAGGAMPAAEKPMAAGAGRRLRKDINADMFPREALDDLALAVPPEPVEPFVVREYAHLRTSPHGDVRTDDTETVYWNPVLVLPGDGNAQVSFQLSDQVTSFQVLAAGHTLDGRLGSVTALLEARKPFTLEPKLPIEVTAGDKIDVPVAFANNTDQEKAIDFKVQPINLSLLEGSAAGQMTLPAGKRTRKLFRLQPSVIEGEAAFRASGGQGDNFADSVQRSFTVVPEGFPVVGTRSDMLEKTTRNELVLPESWVKGTLKCQLSVYPSTLADLQKGLEGLLREPCGCFEQTSTSNYPNLLILDYLKESDQAKPVALQRAQDLLTRGYQRLTAYESPSHGGKVQREGYEWFGAAPAHEALTAYGLMQFRDMARVHDVDKNMIERTKNYLMSRKDGKGGFQRSPVALDTFGRAPQDITNAYIVWALTESSKDDDVKTELDSLSDKAKSSKDPYFLALVAISQLNRDRANDGLALLKRLTEAQKEDGHLDGTSTSITGSGGRDLQIETTALAVLGWIKANRPAEFNVSIQKAIKWLGQQRGGYGGFGSTQSTILTLKALITYTKANKKTTEAGEVILKVGDHTVKQPFKAGEEEAIVVSLGEAEQHLKPGKNTIDLEITGKNVFPYTLTWTYQTIKPISDDQCTVGLTTSLDRPSAQEGETVRLNVTVENKLDKGQGMAVAIVGLPGGLTIPEDLKQLKDHARLRNDGKERGLIGAFEIRGRELILYWRDLAPKQQIEVPVDLICRVPGEYRGPASRAYLYYNADHKCWVDPLQMAIAAKAAE